VSGTFNARGQLEPGAAAMVAIFGPKGSGKSVLATTFAMAWPRDMVVIDVAGDDGPDERPRDKPGTHDVHTLRGPVDELPTAWPEESRDRNRPMILRYVPDPGSPTEAEDMDHMVGLAFNHSQPGKPAMLVVHEIGRVAPAGRTQPHMRRVVNHSRHQGLTCVWAGPRTITVEPLVISQADLVYAFRIRQPGDRRRIAENIGWDPREFDAAIHALPQYESLRFDAKEEPPEQEGDEDRRLVQMGPLPPDVVKAALAWAHPQ